MFSNRPVFEVESLGRVLVPLFSGRVKGQLWGCCCRCCWTVGVGVGAVAQITDMLAGLLFRGGLVVFC